MARLNLIGRVFTNLLVIDFSGLDKNQKTLWKCVCKCGDTIIASGNGLNRGFTTSCGCKSQSKIVKHGASRTLEYVSWRGMFTRCYIVSHPDYKNYGGRGVKVCDRWTSFQSFLEDMGTRDSNLSIERINVNGDYCPENCTWATKQEQVDNRRCSPKNYGH